MFEKITPEQAGISSNAVAKYISIMQRRGVSLHSVLMLKDGKLFCEAYWKPFDKDFKHRMYSQTKSFVGVAIGLLLEEGKLTLDDKVADYFPDRIDGEVAEYLKNQTIREMLTMCTAGCSSSWFVSEDPDRTHQYFMEKRRLHPSGTLWCYDSPGSQVLCSLVEKLAGKSLLDYMKEKLFNKMGAFQNATVLKTRNGDSWGDSAMICTPRDMASFGQLVMNYGTWDGERLMSEAYLKEATSKVVDNRENCHYSVYSHGYGYQIWRIDGNGFAFVGMGNQLTLCYPDKGIMLVTTADCQGAGDAPRELIMGAFEDLIKDDCKDTALPEDKEAQARLEELISGLELYCVKGMEDSPFRAEVDGQEYICNENPMGITKFSFHFNGNKGEFRYTNAQGDKVLPFGINHNVFGKFPQLGYSNDFGGMQTTDGFMYDDAVSFAWYDEKKIGIYAQVIDRYFGNVSMIFGFKGDEAWVTFTKTAEDFMKEYVGSMYAKKA